MTDYTAMRTSDLRAIVMNALSIRTSEASDAAYEAERELNIRAHFALEAQMNMIRRNAEAQFGVETIEYAD